MKAVNYANATKDNWRRWQWNEICRRLKARNIKRKDARVAYLCGDKNIDAVRAIEHGFSRHNLFAVDRDEECVENARTEGVVGLHCDLIHLLAVADKDFFDVVIADLTGGVVKRTAYLAHALVGCASLRRGAVACVNFLRGRDPFFLDQRDAFLKNIDHMSELSKRGGNKGFLAKCVVSARKRNIVHRGAMFMGILQQVTFDYLSLVKSTDPSVSTNPDEFWETVLWTSDPRFSTYKSSGELSTCRFDSVVFTKRIPGYQHSTSFDYNPEKWWEKTRRDFIAAKAVSTMVKDGKMKKVARFRCDD